MDCPPKAINYIYPHPDLTNFHNKMICNEIGRTVFYCYNGQCHRFSAEHSRSIGKHQNYVLTALVLPKLPKITTKTISDQVIMSNLKKYSEVLELSPNFFIGINNIKISWDGHQLVTVPSVLPLHLEYSSAYFQNQIWQDCYYLPHGFYNELVNSYGYLNPLTLLVLFINKFTECTIEICPEIPYKLELFKTGKLWSSLRPRLKDSERLVTEDLPMLPLQPVINPSKLLVAYQRETNIAPDFIPLVVCCYIENMWEWCYLCWKLLELEQQIKYHLVFTYTDSELEKPIKMTFPDAESILIPHKGADIGGFMQALNSIFSGTRNYRYLLKFNYCYSHSLRQCTDQNLLSKTANIIGMLEQNHQKLAVGSPINKLDFMHIHWISKYITSYKIENNLNNTLVGKLGTQSKMQISRKTNVWRNISKKSNEHFISSGIFLCRTAILSHYQEMIDSYVDLTPGKSILEIQDNYSYQYPELAWYRIFGIMFKL